MQAAERGCAYSWHGSSPLLQPADGCAVSVCKEAPAGAAAGPAAPATGRRQVPTGPGKAVQRDAPAVIRAQAHSCCCWSTPGCAKRRLGTRPEPCPASRRHRTLPTCVQANTRSWGTRWRWKWSLNCRSASEPRNCMVSGRGVLCGVGACAAVAIGGGGAGRLIFPPLRRGAHADRLLCSAHPPSALATTIRYTADPADRHKPLDTMSGC